MLILSVLTISGVTSAGFNSKLLGLDSKIHNFARKAIGKIPTTIAILLVLNFPIAMINKAVKKAIWNDKELYGDMKKRLKGCNDNDSINFKNVNEILGSGGGPFDMPSDLENKIRNALAKKDQNQTQEALNELRQTNEQYRRTIWMNCFIETLGGIGVGVGLLSGVLALKS